MAGSIRSTSTATGGSPTLAAASLPARVRHVLQAVNTLAGQTLTTSINLALNELERQLFNQAERARSSQHQSDNLAELQRLRQHRADLVPQYLAGLEAALARLREPPAAEPEEDARPDPMQFQRLTLVEDTDLDRDIVLREIGRREAQRGGTPLLLLGQRFGVLAGRPAFDPERLPIGPYALCLAACDLAQDDVAVQVGVLDQGQPLVLQRVRTRRLGRFGLRGFAQPRQGGFQAGEVARHQVGTVLAQALQFGEVLGLVLAAPRAVGLLEQLAFEFVEGQVERGGQALPGQGVHRLEKMAHARGQRRTRKRARRCPGIRRWADIH